MDSKTLRVSDADRDAVLTELGRHFQAGRLDPAELDDRTGRALRARIGSDLDELLTDLPRAAQPATRPPAPARPRPRRLTFVMPVLIAGALITAVLVTGGQGVAGHHPWAFGWVLWWVVPVMAMRMLWWRRIGGARPWR